MTPPKTIYAWIDPGKGWVIDSGHPDGVDYYQASPRWTKREVPAVIPGQITIDDIILEG